MDTTKVIIGVLAGVAVGAAIGVLFSPDKGVNTRKKIEKKGEDLIHELEDGISEIYNSIAKKYGHVSDEAKELAQKGKNKVKAAINEMD
jgi:gas vesicle protein